MKRKKDKNGWLESYRKVRKKMPPPTKVRPAKKGKGAPYRRKRDQWDERGGSE
jgi:hypothetical protein